MPSRKSGRIGFWLFLALAILAAYFGWREFQRQLAVHPERFPWTDLKLSDPIGAFTAIKLAALTTAPEKCLALLDSAGFAGRRVEAPIAADEQCRVPDAVLVRPENRASIDYSPSGLKTSCPIAAALILWERDVVQPAAQRHFDSRVVRIDHAGSFNCRRLYGRSEGRFSEHATADAVDILAFRLGNGRRMTILRDWHGDAKEAAFLREVRSGACDLFSTVLSPDYNPAHADHFHFDLAERGRRGWRLCR